MKITTTNALLALLAASGWIHALEPMGLASAADPGQGGELTIGTLRCDRIVVGGGVDGGVEINCEGQVLGREFIAETLRAHDRLAADRQVVVGDAFSSRIEITADAHTLGPRVLVYDGNSGLRSTMITAGALDLTRLANSMSFVPTGSGNASIRLDTESGARTPRWRAVKGR